MKDANMNFFKNLVMKYGQHFKQKCNMMNQKTGGMLTEMDDLVA